MRRRVGTSELAGFRLLELMPRGKYGGAGEGDFLLFSFCRFGGREVEGDGVAHVGRAVSSIVEVEACGIGSVRVRPHIICKFELVNSGSGKDD